MFVLRLLILCLFFCIALAQSRSASFAYPPTPGGSTPLLTINVIDTIVVEWTSNFQPAYLWLFCDVPTTDSPTIVKWANISVTGVESWLFSPDPYKGTQIWTRPLDCHFDLNYENDYNKGINGPHFNITSVASQAATTYSSSQTITPLSSSGLSRATAASNTQSDSPSSTTISSATTTNEANQSIPSSNPDIELSAGAKAGIAIGAVAGLIVLVALAIMVWRNKREVGKLQSRLSDIPGSEMHQDVGASPEYRYKDTYSHQAVVAELEPEIAPQELPGSEVVVNEP